MDQVDDNQSFQPRPSKITKIDQMDLDLNVNDNHDEMLFDENLFQVQQLVKELNTEDDHSLDGGAVDDENDPSTNDNHDSCQQKTTQKLLKIEEEFDDKNPFQIPVILDILFKMLRFDDVKKFRLISSTWTRVGFSELSRRPQKPIIFNTVEELEDNDNNKLGSLVQLQKNHNLIFPAHNHQQLFSNFSFKVDLLPMRDLQIEQLFDHFPPKCVKLFGNTNSINQVEKPWVKILVKMSPTVQEFENNYYGYFSDKKGMQENYEQELTSTPFPNLRKISSNTFNDISHLCFYSLIGQNSPNLSHLNLKWDTTNTLSLENVTYMKEQFGLMLSKLKTFSVLIENNIYNRAQGDELKLFTEFGQSGLLKLTKLKFEQFNCQLIKELYLPFIVSQAETLRILEITFSSATTKYSNNDNDDNINIRPSIRNLIHFPTLQNLTILKIDYFFSFKVIFWPIFFSTQTPKLEEFKTCEINRFLGEVGWGRNGDSVKSVTIFKDKREIYNKSTFNLDQLIQVFPNLEYLEMDIYDFYLNVPFTEQLRKVVIHCELQDLLVLRRELLQDAKKVELMVDCGNSLDENENTYKVYLGGLMKKFGGKIENNAEYKKRYKYYQRFLDQLAENFTSLDSVFFTFIGHNIAEDLKQDFRVILPHCAFISRS